MSSSRRLEAEAARNVEVMWLLEKLVPDDKTICNFRKDNAKQLKRVFREFSLMYNRLDLYGKELVAVDGTKNRANSSRKNIHTKKGTEKKLAEIEKKISEYMNELEFNDNAEKLGEQVDSVRISEILEHLKEKKTTLTEWLKKIDENDGKEISTVDPDAHLMHTREPDEQGRRDFRNANGSIAFRCAVLPRFLRQNSETATGDRLTLAITCRRSLIQSTN